MTKTPRTFDLALKHQRAGRLQEAEKLCHEILRLSPERPDVLHLLGVTLHQLGRHESASRMIRKAIELQPENAVFHANLGAAYQAAGKDERAEASYRRALELKPNDPDILVSLGNVLRALKRHDEARSHYLDALDLKPDHPQGHFNLGNALQQLKRHEEAIVSYRRALELKPDYLAAYNNLGSSLKDLRRYDEAVASYRRALELKPHHPEIHNNLGNALKALKRHNEAIASYKRALELRPGYGNALSMLINEQSKICDWSDYPQLEESIKNCLKAGEDAISPFSLLAFSDDPAVLLHCAKKYCAEKTKRIRPLTSVEPQQSDSRIRIAYLSADFHAHATAYLMAELFELHDRKRFEIHAVSFGPVKNSAIRTRLERAFDGWHEVSAMSDREVAKLIRDLGIVIAIDLKGFTQNCRPAILAHRPAPIQISYLGYPGTMGADFIDYILVDRFVAPPDHQAFFTEELVHLPDCYQVNDGRREIAKRTPSRADCGLPDESFVYCCFNNSWKITPSVFDVWMEILRQVEGSVLWLLEDNRCAKGSLRKEAARRGMDPDRLFFAQRQSLPEHLARQRQADLFLDTLPCNAHTTASDALWAGLPVLTCMGRSFHARVAASLLHAVGLPELITSTLEEYGALAVKLASNPDLLVGYQRHLADTRGSVPLFDCARFTRNLEDTYLQLLRRWHGALTQI